MSENPVRGQISARLPEGTFELCLTLHALAVLQARLRQDNLSRLLTVLLSTRQERAIRWIVTAALQGGGAMNWKTASRKVHRLSTAGCARLAMRVIRAALGARSAAFGQAKRPVSVPSPANQLRLEDMLAFAVRDLKIAPAQFWQLGLREFFALIDRPSPVLPTGGYEELSRLMASFELRQEGASNDRSERKI